MIIIIISIDSPPVPPHTLAHACTCPPGKGQPEYPLSEALQAVTGVSKCSRPQVVKKLWEYIRANNLQNPENKREILCDDRFAAVMGGRKMVTMFSMNKYVGEHILKD